VAEEALLEETVVDAGRGKKEKPSAGRKKGEVDREEREACRGYSVAGEELGWWRRLGRSWSQHCWGGNGWKGGREREKRERIVSWEKKQERG